MLTCIIEAYAGTWLICMFILLTVAYSVGVAVIFMIVICIMSALVDDEKPQKTVNRLYMNVLKGSMGIVCAGCRVKVHMTGEEKIPDGKFLLVGNHTSNFDPLITIWMLRKHDFAFVSKPENLKLPIFGKFMHKCCFLSLDRDNDRAALRTILDAAELIRSDTMCVAIYPEGTRNHGQGLLPFKNGAFKIAQKAKAPIVVLHVKNMEKIAKNAPLKRTDVYMDILDVIPAETVAALKTNELGDMIRERMLAAENA